MKAPEFEEMADDLYLLKIPFAGIWAGVYLVKRERNILIDSGLNANDADSVIRPALNRIGLDVPKIDLLLCTHTHGDHIGGHARLKELGIRQTGVYSAGLDKIRDPLKYSKLIRSVFPEYSAPSPAKLDGVEPDLIYDDGAQIDDLQLIASPGHDSDCVCFYDTRTKTLLTGDSIQGNGTDTQGCALYMYLPDYERSLGKLRDLDVAQVITGHPFHPWVNERIENGKAFSDCLELLKKYDTFLNENAELPLPELCVKLIEHLHGKVPEKLFLAMYTVREHLKKRNRK